MSPQLQTVLNHLQNFGSLSTAEAATVYKIRSLPTRIRELKDLGYNITVELKKDPTGQRYARYSLVGVEPNVPVSLTQRIHNFIKGFKPNAA